MNLGCFQIQFTLVSAKDMWLHSLLTHGTRDNKVQFLELIVLLIFGMNEFYYIYLKILNTLQWLYMPDNIVEAMYRNNCVLSSDRVED